MYYIYNLLSSHIYDQGIVNIVDFSALNFKTGLKS